MIAANELRAAYQLENVAITLDRDGLVLSTPGGTSHHPISPHEICDITGAGDTALAVLGLGFAARYRPAARAGLSWDSIAELVNAAAGLQVARPGVAPITRDEWLREFAQNQGVDCSTGNLGAIKHPANKSPINKKLISMDDARDLARNYRRSGQKIVFTNGCFDLLHVGHVSMLEEAARFGDVLFVAVNGDQSVRSLKGPTRPIVTASDRAKMIASLSCVDHVLIFDELTPHRLIEVVRPDVLVKGGTTPEIVGREIVESYGGRIERTGEIPDLSTTSVIAHLSSMSRTSREKEVI